MERTNAIIMYKQNIRYKYIHVSIYTWMYSERGRVGVVSALFTKSIWGYGREKTRRWRKRIQEEAKEKSQKKEEDNSDEIRRSNTLWRWILNLSDSSWPATTGQTKANS